MTSSFNATVTDPNGRQFVFNSDTALWEEVKPDGEVSDVLDQAYVQNLYLIQSTGQVTQVEQVVAEEPQPPEQPQEQETYLIYITPEGNGARVIDRQKKEFNVFVGSEKYKKIQAIDGAVVQEGEFKGKIIQVVPVPKGTFDDIFKSYLDLYPESIGSTLPDGVSADTPNRPATIDAEI